MLEAGNEPVPPNARARPPGIEPVRSCTGRHRELPQPRGADHRRVVGRQRERRHEHRQAARGRAPRLRRAAGCSPTRRRRCRRCARRASAPPRTCDRAARRRRRAGSSRRCRRRLAAERRAERVRSAPSSAGRPPLAHQPQDRGLQAAEAEIDAPRDVGRQQARGRRRAAARCDRHASAAPPGKS